MAGAIFQRNGISSNDSRLFLFGRLAVVITILGIDSRVFVVVVGVAAGISLPIRWRELYYLTPWHYYVFFPRILPRFYFFLFVFSLSPVLAASFIVLNEYRRDSVEVISDCYRFDIGIAIAQTTVINRILSERSLLQLRAQIENEILIFWDMLSVKEIRNQLSGCTLFYFA